jgi:hypothetical protein
MSDEQSDNRSAAGSTKSNSSSSSQKKFPSGSVVKIGIEELRGFYYVYGRPDQAQMLRKTTGKIADYVAQNYKSGKEMYRLITYGLRQLTRTRMILEKMQHQPRSRPMDYSSQVLGRTDSNTTMTSSRPSGLLWGSAVLQ